jgi:hypothetical protein
MLYNTQSYWGFGLYPSSGVLKTRKQRFGNWFCFRPQLKGEIPTLLGPLERANLSHWTVMSKSELLNDWLFTANKFVLASSPLRIRLETFFNWSLAVIVLITTTGLVRWISFSDNQMSFIVTNITQKYSESNEMKHEIQYIANERRNWHWWNSRLCPTISDICL